MPGGRRWLLCILAADERIPRSLLLPIIVDGCRLWPTENGSDFSAPSRTAAALPEPRWPAASLSVPPWQVTPAHRLECPWRQTLLSHARWHRRFPTAHSGCHIIAVCLREPEPLKAGGYSCSIDLDGNIVKRRLTHHFYPTASSLT
ncbi:hypothetical protein DPX16_5132 [Anabarilius grahami]|uniref:Uncharacterized protein n=1 Tax=Anabarilius grahami TaxID=495550 RepID=A0A3N0XKZ1_ANAGA|nr:hypothetical protein DPX16_5132 [Anabarilius grahami]